MPKSLADQLSPQLPYLRRFARALCGSQEAGDAYIVVMLEALVADRSLYDASLPHRVAAYSTLLKIWSSVPVNQKAMSAEAGPIGVADRRIDTLAPASRQAFLLAGLEDFSSAEIALMMQRTEEEVLTLIDEASREIATQIAARIMIIEDEPLIAMDIESLVTDLGHEVVGIAATRKEAVDLGQKQRPGMILADIQLADGSSGIDAVNEILGVLDVPVVFITAYPERLLTGERPEPAFLITKPFKPEMVKAVISQALFFDVKAGGGRRGAAA
jgi:CheY-like chemotaxis protein